MIHRHNQRRGVIIPLAALLAVFLLGMVGFAVDVGWMVVSQSELQNAADAAALAGAGPLMDGHVLYNLPGNNGNQTTILANAKTNARNKAKEYGGYNGAGGVNSLSILDGDIEFGFTDANGVYTASTALSGYPNTIKVTVRRDSTANGALTLFFGRALGQTTTTLTATASATLFAGSLTSIPGPTLPLTYSQNDWNTFRSTGRDADGDLSKDANGNPELLVFDSVKDSGNFGWLSMDNGSLAASTLRGWIDNGVSQAEIDILKDDGLIPLSSHPNAWDWQGKPGFTSSDVKQVNDHVGEIFVLPLYKPYSATSPGDGNGSNYYYNVVEFVSVRLTAPDRNNRDIIVQPAPLVVANALLDPNNIVPAGTTATSTTTTIFAAPRLTR